MQKSAVWWISALFTDGYRSQSLQTITADNLEYLPPGCRDAEDNKRIGLTVTGSKLLECTWHQSRISTITKWDKWSYHNIGQLMYTGILYNRSKQTPAIISIRVNPVHKKMQMLLLSTLGWNTILRCHTQYYTLGLYLLDSIMFIRFFTKAVCGIIRYKNRNVLVV